MQGKGATQFSGAASFFSSLLAGLKSDFHACARRDSTLSDMSLVVLIHVWEKRIGLYLQQAHFIDPFRINFLGLKENLQNQADVQATPQLSNLQRDTKFMEPAMNSVTSETFRRKSVNLAQPSLCCHMPYNGKFASRSLKDREET